MHSLLCYCDSVNQVIENLGEGSPACEEIRRQIKISLGDQFKLRADLLRYYFQLYKDQPGIEPPDCLTNVPTLKWRITETHDYLDDGNTQTPALEIMQFSIWSIGNVPDYYNDPQTICSGRATNCIAITHEWLVRITDGAIKGHSIYRSIYGGHHYIHEKDQVRLKGGPPFSYTLADQFKIIKHIDTVEADEKIVKILKENYPDN